MALPQDGNLGPEQEVATLSDNIIPYHEMCLREKRNLQRGMHFGLGDGYSVILMSLRRGAPYRDSLEDGGTTLIYEGHDQPKNAYRPNPKLIDQVDRTGSGKPTENGRFHAVAQETKAGRRSPELVKVYEKIHSGIWNYNGVFHLTDSWTEFDGKRRVFKFKLIAIEGDVNLSTPSASVPPRRRIIPTAVKLAVWKRDGGKCVQCGAADELHFDHDLPWSKGGTSLTESNVQLLCARHNLQKSDQLL